MRKTGVWNADWFHGLARVLKRFLGVDESDATSLADTKESARRHGQALQRQGQLDEAFDTFRTCSQSDVLMGDLDALALAFEGGHQYSKAAAVYRYMAAYNPKFTGLEQRLDRASVCALLPNLVLNEKPMLGPYQVERVLGKGAMGAVFLGFDTVNQRQVAIKTMALSQAFDADELVEVKSRFFREAETAGKLDHPNVVRIYGAREEGGLAYIAMEFIKGSDLAQLTKPDHRLPWAEVVSIIARVADALAYAHRNNVVHRDVKPANVMYDPLSGQVKVTDFGVARITDSSKTKTGLVLGTPSYMSPEQLLGKKVDGRSDLFSLGVVLYQMLCGQLPFVDTSMAKLMNKIVNSAPPDIRTLNSGLPDKLVTIIDRALSKNSEQRYQSGDEMARDLRACHHDAEVAS